MIVDEMTAFTEAQAANIAGVRRQRLQYWDSTGLITPDVKRDISPRNIVRLYSFQRVVELVVASELRRQGVSLQHIRRIVNHLRQLGYDVPLSELVFARSGGHVLFQHPDGSWEDSNHPFQGVMRQVIDLEEIRARVRSRAARRSDDAGSIEKRRKVQASKPVFAGTRVPVEAVSGYLRAGRSHAEILEAFPSLTLKDIESAEAQLSTVA